MCAYQHNSFYIKPTRVDLKNLKSLQFMFYKKTLKQNGVKDVVKILYREQQIEISNFFLTC